MKKLGCTSAIKKIFLFVLHSILCNFVAEIKKIAMNGIVRQEKHALLLMDANVAFAEWILKRYMVKSVIILFMFII